MAATQEQPPVRLNELDRDEWREVCRILRPDWSEEEFDRAWSEFQELKRRRALH